MTTVHRVFHSIFIGALATALVTPALAQDEGAELEEIVVTGSYLYSGVDSPSPVTVFSGEDVLTFAPPDLATFFFDNVPQNYSDDSIDQTDARGMARSRSNRNASINLRGLGDENTLTVINGRRTIGFPVPDGTGWNRVDINSLVPKIAVERIELLLDGGSAIFGSDPVAGVANFVTRNNFRGFDFALDSRTLEEIPDAKNYTASILFGSGDDRTSIVAAIEFHQEDRVTRNQVDSSFFDNVDVTPETGSGLEEQEGLLYGNGGMGMAAASWVDPLCGDPQFGILAFIPAYEDEDEEFRETTLDQADFCARPNNYDNGFELINNNVKQLIAFVRAEHDFGDALRVNAEFNFSRQRFDDVDMWGDGGTGQVWSPVRPQHLGTAYAFPASHPGLLYNQGLDPNFGLNSMGQAQPVYSLEESMPYGSEMDAFAKNDVMRAGIGLEGDISANWTWLVDTTVAYSEVYNGIRDPIVAFYPDAVAGLGGAKCDPAVGTPGEGSCFYYNPFMNSQLANAAELGLANSPELLDWLIPNRIDHFLGEFFTVDARVTGSFGELPGGPIGLAVGVGYREDFVERDADASVNGGLTATTGIVNDFVGKQSIDSLYFELALPVHDNVNVQIAARDETYDIGFSKLSPKIAALWTPTDRLTIRGSWGTSFKGPSISQTAAATQFQGGHPNSLVVDGIRFGAMGMASVAFETQPNFNLLPQSSENISLGFDFVVNDNIDVGASWVSIDFTDRIVAPTANVVSLNLNCIVNVDGIPTVFNINTGEAFPQGTGGNHLKWISPEEGGCMVPADPNQPLFANNHGLIVSQPGNLGSLEAEFLDLRTVMRFDTGIGAIAFTPSITIATKYQFPLDPGVASRPGMCPNDICSTLGRDFSRGFSNGINQMPRWQGHFSASLTRGSHFVRLSPSYRDALNEAYDDLDPGAISTQRWTRASGQWVLDAQWTWLLNEGTSVGLTLKNLFATEPPITQQTRFNRRLREYSLQFRHSFVN